jgi:hypothetical protein
MEFKTKRDHAELGSTAHRTALRTLGNSASMTFPGFVRLT